MENTILLSAIIINIILTIVILLKNNNKTKEKDLNDTTSEKISKELELRLNALSKEFENLIKLNFSNEIPKITEILSKNTENIMKNLSENNNAVLKTTLDFKKDMGEQLKKEFITINNKVADDLLKITKSNSTSAKEINSKLSQNNEKILNKINVTNEKVLKDSAELKENLNKNITKFKDTLSEQLKTNFNFLTDKVEKNLLNINDKVETKLSEGFEKTNKTFSNILERLSKIDEAQKKIDNLSTDIVSLQDVLTDKKSRGIFGEVQLNQILHSIFGEKNDKVFRIQYTLSNETIADSVLFLPDPVGTIAIDSKFPLENYKKMTDKLLEKSEKINFEKAFKKDIKNHIDAISNKYIIPGETSNQAIMFLPAEAIFAEINAYHPDLVEYSQNKKVWICSPTTLMSVLSTMQVVLKNLEREKYSDIIHQELNKLGTEFSRYKTRWESLAKHIDNVTKDVKEITTTTNKIGTRFEKIKDVKIDKENLISKI